jgi:predicted XRE-type DNA-binding protein
MKEAVVVASGNVFSDLGFGPEEAALLAMCAQLMADLRDTIAQEKWTQTEAAKVLGVSQSRVSDLVRGCCEPRGEKFNIDMLVTLVVRCGKQVQAALAPA